MKNAAKITVLGILALSCCQTANAQWGRRSQGQGGMFVRMQARSQQRWDNRNQQISMRTGRPVEVVDARRTQRWQTVAAVIGGVGAGLSGYSSAIGYSSPTIQPYRSTTSSYPSAAQMQWRSYNMNYSSNPYHAAANGF